MIDARLSAIVQNATEEDGDRLRELAQSLGMLAPRVPQPEFIRYRYQIDIDGNTNSWSLLLKLAMGSCVLKVQSPYRQWYYCDLRPWEHYVPVRADLCDLEEKVLWCRKHDADARQIAEAGKRFVDERVFGTEMTRGADLLLESALPPFARLPNSPAHPTRVPGLKIELVDGACIVKHPARGRVHHLSPSAALVLELCDGNNPEADLPRLVQLAYDLPQLPTESVTACIDQFKQESLLR